MNGKAFTLVALGLVALTAACSQPTTTTPVAAEAKMSDMANSPVQATGAITSAGVVTQVDATAGTITFDHQAIPAINWPAMTMQFHAENPAILHGIGVGDHVTFELKSATETQTVTAVQKQ